MLSNYKKRFAYLMLQLLVSIWAAGFIIRAAHGKRPCRDEVKGHIIAVAVRPMKALIPYLFIMMSPFITNREADMAMISLAGKYRIFFW